MENKIYEWNFSDEKNRSPFWYIIAISIIIWIVFWWIFSWQYGLSIVTILAFWVTFFVENNSQKDINVKISTLGIKISENFYDFWKIGSFSFLYQNSEAVFLKLNLKKRWFKSVNLKIDNKICEDLKNILPNFIEEEKDGELSFLDKIINFLKL